MQISGGSAAGSEDIKRPLALFERALYLDGQLPVSVTVTACLRGRIDEASMRHALDRVQAKHPILRCLILPQDGRPWFVLQDPAPPIPLRIVERQNGDDWVAQSMRESLQRFDGSREPLARLIWVRGETHSELVLVCHHAVCDGRSTLTLLREILLLCDQPDRAIGRHTSLNAIRDVFPAKVLADRALQRRIRWKVAVLKLLLRLPRARRSWSYGEIYRNFWALDEAASQRLVERCKTEHVNAFAAINVAFMLAFREVCGAKGIEKFVAPVDVRRHLPGLEADSLFAVAGTVTLSLGATRADKLARTDFWDLARALETDMKQKIKQLGPSIRTNFLGMEHLHGVYHRMIAYAGSQRAGRQVSLSYVGRLKFVQEYRDFRLESIKGLSATLAPTPANLVGISYFAGRFDLSFASDEVSLPQAQAARIRDMATATLLACAAPSVAVIASAPAMALVETEAV
ncbi:MAG: condensation domain-containing protein [Luteimonas sp.]